MPDVGLKNSETQNEDIAAKTVKPDNAACASQTQDNYETVSDPISDLKAQIQSSLTPIEPAVDDEVDEFGSNNKEGLFFTLLIWGGAGLALLAVVTALLGSRGEIADGVLLALGIGFSAGLLLLVAFLTRADRLRRRRELARAVATSDIAGPSELAGAAMLSALSLSEKVLDTDDNAVLITRRDGVVAYANRAYQKLARDAGVSGLAGLPPRIDRLFSQQGNEATKIFRLCRAAKSGREAEETICQLMGIGGGVRRRFDVRVRPVASADNFVAWRLRELSQEVAETDVLAAAYAEFVEPVFAVEKSGQIAWANAAMREKIGAARGALSHIDDIALGETADLVSALWRNDQTEVDAIVRDKSGEPVEATLKAFRRGGIGEGFVCVHLEAEEVTRDADGMNMPGNLADAPFGIVVVEGEIGRDAQIIEANKTFSDAFKTKKVNASLSNAFSAEALNELAAEIRKKSNSGGAPRAIEASIEDGTTTRHFSVIARPVRRRRGSYGPRKTYLFTIEITDRKLMEQDYSQDQKLKALGHIAGGVAHDFNNILQVVLGNCEHLMLRHPAGDPAYQELVSIRENAQRAANLTKQLLAFSRKQTLTTNVHSITDVLLDFARFLDRAVGEKVKLSLSNGRGLPNVKVDRNQFENAIMNLAVNARDAMAPDGGALAIKTRFVSADEVREKMIPDLDPQDYVEIELSDTGPGVPKEIVDKIFDPYFTTKGEGKGTGLGLSTVHGIIGQMGGSILLDRESDKGAIFRIYLPTTNEEIKRESDEASLLQTGDYTGSGRILVVEDEAPVRAIVVATLERSGYDVTAVEDGVDALELMESGENDFDLVISDIMMPEIDGPTFVDRARREHGIQAGVIFISGYAETAMRDQLEKIDGSEFLQKPFPMATLGAKVKETLQSHTKTLH